MPTSKRIEGDAGEAIARAWLVRKRYKILAANYTCKSGELDLVAKKGKVIVVVEVKRRMTDTFGTPAEAVTAEKRRHIVRATEHFLLENDLVDRPVRFDVIEIFGTTVNHIESAFDANE